MTTILLMLQNLLSIFILCLLILIESNTRPLNQELHWVRILLGRKTKENPHETD